MAFNGSFEFSFTAEESYEADAIQLQDSSENWSTDQAIVSALDMTIQFPDGVEYTYDIYGAAGKWLAFIQEGCEITLDELIAANPTLDASRFEDGVYIITLVINDGTYSIVDAPAYVNYEGFLALNWQRFRFAPTKIPLENNYIEVRELFQLMAYIIAADAAADAGELDTFTDLIEFCTAIFEKYEIEEV